MLFVYLFSGIIVWLCIFLFFAAMIVLGILFYVKANDMYFKNNLNYINKINKQKELMQKKKQLLMPQQLNQMHPLLKIMREHIDTVPMEFGPAHLFVLSFYYVCGEILD